MASFILLGTAWSSPVFGQTDTISDFVFDDTSIPDVLITIESSLLDAILAPGNQYSDEEHPATFVFARGTDSTRVDSIGFRLRGNTSRDAQKKSFKVSFNSFRRGQKFAGLEKLNLNGEHNDPSLIRSKIGWDLFRAMGVPASRANHVRLFINGAYYGLYVNVEHVDEQFLQRYFGSDAGNLYKCLWPADLSWLGADPESYRPTEEDRRPYDLRLKDNDLEGYDDLVRLIDVLNHSSAVDFPDTIEAVFNVNGFLRALALTTITGSWDSYWFLKNNYYLYSDPETGRFEYIPFDFDNILGIWWEGIYPGLDWTTRDVYTWGHPDPGELRPLTDRILSVPEFRERYTLYVKKLLSGPFDEVDLPSRILDLRSMIDGAAIADTYRPLDYGFSSQDFYDSYFQGLGGHVTEGLVPFVISRASSAAAQIDPVDVTPVVSDVFAIPAVGRPGAQITVVARAEDEESPLQVRLKYRIDRQPEQVSLMTLLGGPIPDQYAVTMSAPDQPSKIDYIVEATDGSGQVGLSNMLTLHVLGDIDLVLNEIMASNVATVTDEAGEYDDWVELYNAGTAPLNIGGFTLTDDRSRPGKWVLPDTTIESGGFLVAWADEDGSQGSLHANFKISRLGEYLGLFDAAGVPLDTMSFGPQTDDISLGRTPDGSLVWSQLWSATPGSANTGAVGLEPSPFITSALLSAHPNPFSSDIQFRVPGERGGSFEVFDLLGRKLLVNTLPDYSPSTFIWDGYGSDGAAMPSGAYVVRFTSTTGSVRTSSAVRIR